MSLAEALLDLQELTRQLRRDCPWDREQTALTIVPHTLEEAYEVADAAIAGDDSRAPGRARRPPLPGVFPVAAPGGARRGRPRVCRPWGAREARPATSPCLRGSRRRHRWTGARAVGADQVRAGRATGNLPRRPCVASRAPRGAQGSASRRDLGLRLARPRRAAPQGDARSSTSWLGRWSEPGSRDRRPSPTPRSSPRSATCSSPSSTSRVD